MKQQNKTIIRLLFGALFIWNGLILLAPVLGQSAWRPFQLLGGGIYFFMDPVCHQLPQRSLFLHNLPFPVCARCFSIYLAGLFVFAAAVLKKNVHSWPFRTYAFLGLAVLAAMVLEKTGVLPDLNEVRFASGLLAGFFLFRLLLESFLPLAQEESPAASAQDIVEER